MINSEPPLENSAGTASNERNIDPEIEIEAEIDINLRPAADVARRAIILSAVCARAYLELARTTRLDLDTADTERFDLLAWLDHESLIDNLSDAEHRLLASRIRKISKQSAIEASWEIEALAALVWALDLLPAALPYDHQADSGAVLSTLPEPMTSTAAFSITSHLRSLSEIAAERERAELWHWRSQLADELAMASPEEQRELRTIIADVAAEAALAGLISGPIRGDFPVAGRPYAAVAADDQTTLAIIAAHRLHAFNWICGYGTNWENVPLDIQPE